MVSGKGEEGERAAARVWQSAAESVPSMRMRLVKLSLEGCW